MYRQIKKVKGEREISKYQNYEINSLKLTSAHALGRTKRPIRPASLALRTFSNSGTMVEFKLKKKK